MKLNALVIDDETMSRKVLSRLAEDHQFLSLSGEASSGKEAIDFCHNNHVDLIFLDIVMPEMSGLEFLNSLNESPYVILTSSHKEYALEGFEHDVTDYLIKPVKKERFDKSVEKVIEKYRIEKQVPINFEEYVLGKTLKFLISRGMDFLKPIPDRNSSIGHVYALISAHFDLENEQKVLDILQLAEREGLLRGWFYEVIYLCPNCYEGFIHVREVCPKCTSSNLDSEELVHHFPCAYVGPLSDFTGNKKGQGTEFVCPKCDHTLKHIGVDYDKPSMIHNCLNCDHKFQDVFVKARCASCNTDVEVEHLAKRTLKQYEITNKGVEAAKSGSGFLSNQEDTQKIPGTVDMETFTLMLQYEIRRKEMVDFEGNIAFLHIFNSYSLLSELDFNERKNFLTLIVQKMQEHLSHLDIITFMDRSTLIFSVNDTTLDQGKEIVYAIANEMEKHIAESYPSLKPEFTYDIKAIDAGIDHNTQLNTLLKGRDE